MKTKRHQVILRLLCIGTASLFVLSFGGCSASQNAPKDSPGTTANSDISTEEIIAEYAKKGFKEVRAEILYNHYADYEGKKIITAVKVTDTAYHTLYSEIDEDDFLASLSFNFDSEKEMHDAKEGDFVIIAGTGAGKSIIGNYKEFKDCHVVAGDPYASIEYEKLLRDSISAEKKRQAESDSAADNQSSSQSKEKNKTFGFGETYIDDGFEITMTSSEEFDNYSEFHKPDTGCYVLKVDFEIYNGDKIKRSYGTPYFECYADNNPADRWYAIEDNTNELSMYDNLSPGREVKGSIYYEVPQDASTIEIEYSRYGSWTSKPIIFKIK